MALLVAPLAGIALLTAAAAVAINPVLVTVSLTGRRRKRNAEIDEGISPELEEKIHEMQVSGDYGYRKQSFLTMACAPMDRCKMYSFGNVFAKIEM